MKTLHKHSVLSQRHSLHLATTAAVENTAAKEAGADATVQTQYGCPSLITSFASKPCDPKIRTATAHPRTVQYVISMHRIFPVENYSEMFVKF